MVRLRRSDGPSPGVVREVPALVGQVEFVAWTADDHLRHSRFVGLYDDKDARGVARE